jgi:cell division protein FtsI/penicillin-binding protein 2
MAWFAGFAPPHDPTIAFAVVVEYGDQGGSRDAGPVAREAIRLATHYGYIPAP